MFNTRLLIIFACALLMPAHVRAEAIPAPSRPVEDVEATTPEKPVRVADVGATLSAPVGRTERIVAGLPVTGAGENRRINRLPRLFRPEGKHHEPDAQ